MTNTQDQKYHLSMAGEFFVAAELQRHGVAAAVTYGNAKKADVVAFSASGEKAIVIEVKSTSEPRWIVGQLVPAASKKPWVFVYLPTNETEAPCYYVLSGEQLHSIVAPEDTEYRRRFKEKHGIEYGDRRGVVNLTSEQAKEYRNAWQTIIGQLSP